MAIDTHEQQESTPESKLRRGRIAPLLWHRGEHPDIVRREIEAIYSAGIREFVLEPRPHPDYLGRKWWDDVDDVIRTAQELGMGVWLFDDSHFPSGGLNGTVPTHYPNLLKRYLAERHRDARGPAPATTFAFESWIQDGDRLHAVIAIRHYADSGLPEPDSAIDLTDKVDGALLQWDVPDGLWRVFAILETSRGHEARTADYVNPIAEGAAEAHIATVHEPHFARFADHFGSVILGFFQDEPRFGNERTHTFRLGTETGDDSTYVLPYSDLLERCLEGRWGERAPLRLPLLWWGDDDETTAGTRYGYMDEVTRLYEKFQQRLGGWCAAHDVKLIGHVIEDNGAHARLGMGPGHYFRSMAGQHMAGIDVVLQQLVPGSEAGIRPAAAHHWDDSFHYWGLAKLASSAAHIDPRKNGDALCEAFGAYGWHLGLRQMKWLTDHLVVRGINYIVPHAFSARMWDDDCPPHFYNGGMNPQWAYFKHWREYTDRITQHLSGGRHLSDAAVLYHAEAEWAGSYMPFEHVLRELMRSQRDADVVPIDALLESTPDSVGGFRTGSGRYALLIVPYAQRVPSAFARLVIERGIPTVFVDDFPAAVIDDEDGRLLRALKRTTATAPLADIANRVPAQVAITPADPSIRVMRYRKNGRLTLFVVNESTSRTSEVSLVVRDAQGTPVIYDPTTEDNTVARSSDNGEAVSLMLRLDAGESRLIFFDKSPDPRGPEQSAFVEVYGLPLDGWEISLRNYASDKFEPAGFSDLGPVNSNGRSPQFAGTVRYERTVDLSHEALFLELGDVGETAEVFVNDRSIGVRIAPPYRFELPQGEARERLSIEVATTLAPLLASKNVFDTGMPIEPTGLLGPVSLTTPAQKLS